MSRAFRAGHGELTPELDVALGDLWPRLGAPAGTTWAVLPTSHAPRLLVPLQGRKAAAETLYEQSRLASGPARLAGELLALAVRAGLGTPLLRSGSTLVSDPDPGDGLVGHLEELLGTRLQVGVYLGVPRRNRKPVLKLFDPRGDLLAVAKVGIDPLTDSLVRNEHEALTRFVPRDGDAPAVHTPRPLQLLEWPHGVVQVQSALRISRGRRFRAARPDVLATSAWLAGGAAADPRALAGSAWWQELTARVVTAPDGPRGDLLRSHVELAAPFLAAACLPMAPWHGDLTPWNMAVDGTRPQVWDWERYAAQAPVGFDVLHFAIQADAHTAGDVGASVGAALAIAPAILQGVVESADIPTLVVCYALEIATRYVSEGQAELPRGRRVVETLLSRVASIVGTAPAAPSPNVLT